MRRDADGLPVLQRPGWRLVDGDTYLVGGGRREEIGVLVKGDNTPLVDILVNLPEKNQMGAGALAEILLSESKSKVHRVSLT